jgi:hypothetical protein
MFRAFLEKDFHCIGICIGKDKKTRMTVVRAYGAEYMSILSDNMGRHKGSDSFWCPTVSGIRYPSEPTFVLKE